MFDKLIEVILDFISWFQFWVIIDPIEVGIVYTLGRDTDYLTSENGWFGTGFHWIAPFELEEVKVVNVQWDWDAIRYQSLMSKDGTALIVQMGYKYRIVAEEHKIRKFLIELNDEGATRRIAIAAAVCAVVSESTVEELKKGETAVELPDEDDEEKDVIYAGIKKQILDYARSELTPWGYRIGKIEWVQRTLSRTYRFMQDQQTIQQAPPEEEE